MRRRNRRAGTVERYASGNVQGLHLTPLCSNPFRLCREKPLPVPGDSSALEAGAGGGSSGQCEDVSASHLVPGAPATHQWHGPAPIAAQQLQLRPGHLSASHKPLSTSRVVLSDYRTVPRRTFSKRKS